MKIAREQGWETTYDAEYIAVTKLQAGALVTVDPALAAKARDVVPLAPLEAQRGPRLTGCRALTGTSNTSSWNAVEQSSPSRSGIHPRSRIDFGASIPHGVAGRGVCDGCAQQGSLAPRQDDAAPDRLPPPCSLYS